MSSYIKFMFEYLFQADYLASELKFEEKEAGGKRPGPAAAGQVAGSGQEQEEASGCERLYELLVEENKTTSSLRNFAEFELFARQHQQQFLPTLTNGSNSNSNTLGDRSLHDNRTLLGNETATLKLQQCFQQLQFEDYYSHYDIYVGLRIASTLTILFIVFILFVIYKTGCRQGGEPGSSSRSQLQLTSFAAQTTSASSRSRARVKRRPSRAP